MIIRESASIEVHIPRFEFDFEVPESLRIPGALFKIVGYSYWIPE